MNSCHQCGLRYASGDTFCPEDGAKLIESDDDFLGSTVGSYRVVRLLGEGGMGRVYLAVHPRIGSRVAIKMLSAAAACDEELVERFFAEAKLVNKVRHEGIVNVLDLDHLEDGRPYIIMEHLEGESLSAAIARGPMALGTAASIGIEILEALQAAHDCGVVHRDLKPDNIFISPKGRVKLLDFGIAKLMPQFETRAVGPSTRTGSLLGTPGYMAPEQVVGDPVSGATDLYAVGAVLYEALTGSMAFTGSTLFELLRRIVSDQPAPPQERRSDLAGPFQALILQALAKEPRQRPISAKAMALELDGIRKTFGPEQWASLPGLAPGAGTLALGTEKTLQPTPRMSMALGSEATVLAGETPLALGTDATMMAPDTPLGRRIEARALESETPLPTGTEATVMAPQTPLSTGIEATVMAPQTPLTRGTEATVMAPQTPLSERVESTVAAPDQRNSYPTPIPRRRSKAPLVLGAIALSVAGVVALALLPGDAADAGDDQVAALEALDAAPVAGVTPTPSAAIRDAGAVAQSQSRDARQVRPPVRVASPVPAPRTKKSSDAAPVGEAPSGSSGVVLIETDSQHADTRIHKAPDFNPKAFDAVAYLPKARKLAKQIYPDAVLTEFDVYGVAANGLSNLALADFEASYYFLSRSHATPKLPVGSGEEIACWIHVDVDKRGVTARIVEDTDCKGQSRPNPRCSLRQVWELSDGLGTPPSKARAVAHISYLWDGWFFDIDALGVTGSILDGC